MNARLWQPSDERMDHANIMRFITLVNERHGKKIGQYADLYQWSIDNPQHFWNDVWDFCGVIAKTRGEKIVSNFEKMPGAAWFPDARLNYAENLLRGRDEGDRVIFFSNEKRAICTLEYHSLYTRVSALAQALQSDGIKAGDRVAAVLPNIPETVIAMLAATSRGAVWTSCSPDFGVSGLVDRFGQVAPKLMFVCDGYYFNGKQYDFTDRIEAIRQAIPSLKKIIMIPYTDEYDGVGEQDVVELDEYTRGYSGNRPIEFIPVGFNDPLYILYSSGTTGVPKCIVHGVGGTLLQHLKEHQLHVDLHPNDRIFYYTTCGWMMWNWLVTALASNASLVLYDGSPVYPGNDTLFDLVDESGTNVFGVSAKYIDLIKKSTIKPKKTHDLSTLQTVLSTGSPLVAESFDYVYESIKADVCLSSISGGTDIVSCFVLGCPILPVYRGEIQCRGLAMNVVVLDEEGQTVYGQKGELACISSFPSMPIMFWNDPGQQKYQRAYFEKYPGLWCHGDFALLTEHDGMVIYGRSDATLNPGGVRIGTAEIYRQVEQMPEIHESLVIGQQWQGDCRVILFVVLSDQMILTDALIDKIKQRVKLNASPRHVPAKVIQVSDIPRTKSGKIVELAVRNVIDGKDVRNRSALANPETLEQFANLHELRS